MRHRTWAREQDILTERGWQEGYVVFKPSRWMTRFFFDAVLPLNTALNRLEANSFTLLGSFESFSTHARASARLCPACHGVARSPAAPYALSGGCR
jgi:hypothetical protein